MSEQLDNFASRILHCDAACVVVNKIAGEAAEGAGKGMVCLPTLLAAELSRDGYPQPLRKDALSLPTAVHRLDVPVSGCTLFARSGTALGFLNSAFSQTAVEKRYWAIAEMPGDGFVGERFFENPDSQNADSKALELVHWIQFDSRRNKSIAHDEPGPGRKKAVLRYGFVGKGRDYMFLEIELVTGRHHQIRAQLERIGLRIKGDLKYGARRSEKNGGIRLHAHSLSFPDPAGGSERITVNAEPPVQDNLWLAFKAAKLSVQNTGAS
ncbi:MAG: RNA pseudouridine synthase [Treponema sp.]|nr:RNA pseudouridine synthase [Treponema sp.]